MQNGYFQVVRTPGGYGLQIFQPKDGGEDVRLQEVMDYLDRQSIPYDPMSIKKAILAEEDAVCFLERKDCPEIEESCRIEVSEDNLQAIVRFYPASQTGKRATMDSVIKDLRFRNSCRPLLQKNTSPLFLSPEPDFPFSPCRHCRTPLLL